MGLNRRFLESDLSKKFCKLLQYHGHVQRIESLTGSGIPDVNLCIGGRELWIELKRADTYIIKPSQLLWIHRRNTHGGAALIVIGSQLQATAYAVVGDEVAIANDRHRLVPLITFELDAKGVKEFVDWISKSGYRVAQN